MAIAALVLWISTVAIGTYLLATAARIGKTESAPAEPVPVAAGQPSASPARVSTSSSLTTQIVPKLRPPPLPWKSSAVKPSPCAWIAARSAHSMASYARSAWR